MTATASPQPPRPEYPRPHFDRSHAWLNLNGTWDFAADPHDVGLAEGWPEAVDGDWSATITVPYPWEHPASGIQTHWLPIAWYRRRIHRPADWATQRTVLHFGAVHHHATVWVNGRPAIQHTGGYLPFEADITDLLDPHGNGLVVVRVHAPADKRAIPHGKQRSRPADDYDGCAFTPSSGIWQTVWLESRPATHMAGLTLRPTAALDGIEATVNVSGPAVHGATVTLAIAGEALPRHITSTVDDDGMISVLLPVSQPRLWSPDDPYLYHIQATLHSTDGEDRVTGYTGLRRVDWHDTYLHLNGQPVYLRGVLDQGFWPESGHTAPTDEALRRDLELARADGFNLVRKHIKLEDPRWLYWADRLGILVWAEPPSTGRFGPEAVAAFEQVLTGMPVRDGNHPSIVIWGAYNEEWGLDWDVPGDPVKQAAVRRAYRLLRAADPTRPVVDNSGWAHVQTDLVDWHYYDDDATSWAQVIDRLINTDGAGFPVRLGPDLLVTKHIAAPGLDPTDHIQLNGEYGGGSTSVQRGWHLRWQTQELRRHARNAGYIYTELYDIEHETVGVHTYTRGHKDLGGTRPDRVHATTTFVLDITPLAPGRDLVVPAGAAATVPVRISHHGSQPLQATLKWELSSRPGSAASAPVDAKPFILTEPATVTVTPAAPHDQLRLWLTSPAGEILADTFVDIEDR